MSVVFLHGAHGAVGVSVQGHLTNLLESGQVTEVLAPHAQHSKAEWVAAAMMERADVMVLCLPDAAAIEAVQLAREVNPDLCILDASAAHRCAAGWVYGLTELATPDDLVAAQYVANPGCFATGCILLARPLAELLGDTPMCFQGVTGYTAAGKRGVLRAEHPSLVQFGKPHRHLPEIARYGRVTPILTTTLASWPQGMLVQSTLMHPVEEDFSRLASAYAGRGDVTVRRAGDEAGYALDISENVQTMRVSLLVAEQAPGVTSVAAAYDNLGKGAAGSIARNVRWMLGGA